MPVFGKLGRKAADAVFPVVALFDAERVEVLRGPRETL